MRIHNILFTFTLGLLVSLPFAAKGEEAPDASESSRRVGPLWATKPFDPERLRLAAEEYDPNSGENQRLMYWILRAAIEKDEEFRYLLKMKKLKKAKNMELALAAYRYALDRSEGALNTILAQIATEDIGDDLDSILVLSTLDEWDRSIRAFRKHFVHTDGTGGFAKSNFMSTRSYLYPKRYAAMRDAIEAPIKWTMPLLPKKTVRAEQDGAEQPATRSEPQ